MGCHARLQGIFPTQGVNPSLPHCRRILYSLSHQGSPRISEWVAYPLSRASSEPHLLLLLHWQAGPLPEPPENDSEITQSCPTLCNPRNLYSPWNSPGQILAWVAFPFFRRSSQPRDRMLLLLLRPKCVPQIHSITFAVRRA